MLMRVNRINPTPPGGVAPSSVGRRLRCVRVNFVSEETTAMTDVSSDSNYRQLTFQRIHQRPVQLASLWRG